MTAPDTALARAEPTRDITDYDPDEAGGALAHILGTGDLAQLTGAQRAAHYLHLCKSLGLNPASVPFLWVEFYDPGTKQKKLTLYPAKSCADQLRRVHQIRVRVVEETVIAGLMKVKVEGTTPSGRSCEEVGYVPLTDSDGNVLRGQRYANALMKAHTVAKRRLAFAMVGLATPPERAELPAARRVYLDARGEVIDHPTEEDKYLSDNPDAAKASGRPRFETMAAPEGSPLADTPDQRPTAEELTPTARPDGPRPTLKRDPESMRRLLGAFHAIVRDTSLADDEARHRFVEQWTASIGWPLGKRSSSLRTFFARATDDEAGDLLAHARQIANDERSYLAEAAEAAADDEGRAPF